MSTKNPLIKTDCLIIGAGPSGLFQVFELGLLGIHAHIVDTLPHAGGQCRELYPDKPIYDIPALPLCGAQELVDRLQEQIKPFAPDFHLGDEVSTLSRRHGGGFDVTTAQGLCFDARVVIIAGGMGTFQPRKLPTAGADRFEDQQLHYRVRRPRRFDNQHLVILGGGDSALDWALELQSRAASLTVVHRSAEFRAAPASVAKLRALEQAGKVTVLQGNLSRFVSEQERLQAVEILIAGGSKSELRADHVLAFFGLSPKLGPIADWGLGLEKNQITVDTEKFESSVPGVFAVGDINTYPGKKKLILSGFHEAALAAFAIKARLDPDKKVRLQYTTTSPIMHQRLGV